MNGYLPIIIIKLVYITYIVDRNGWRPHWGTVVTVRCWGLFVTGLNVSFIVTMITLSGSSIQAIQGPSKFYLSHCCIFKSTIIHTYAHSHTYDFNAVTVPRGQWTRCGDNKFKTRTDRPSKIIWSTFISERTRYASLNLHFLDRSNLAMWSNKHKIGK